MASGNHTFADIQHVVRSAVDSAGLVVSVEDQLTLDSWKGSFTKEFIEQLTHKTGNFKTFEVFVAMLEAAVKKTGESVSLEFLSYDFLENLDHQRQDSRFAVQESDNRHKRYLVLTYSTEFDRVHFPLPLLQHTTPDVSVLQRTIRALQTEVQHLKLKDVSKETTSERHRRAEHYDSLRQQLASVTRQRDALLAELEARGPDTGDAVHRKEIGVLKKIITNLEEDMLAEKNRYVYEHKRSAPCDHTTDITTRCSASWTRSPGWRQSVTPSATRSAACVPACAPC